MPTLNWIGKSAVKDHHKEIPYKVLEKDKKLSIGNTKNMLIQGDNLLALKSLLPYYKGKIKCIYIDPPYNTGNESWVYNDKVNSPTIQEWLNKTVGESGDLSMHDKWLCMMYPRLYLLRELLADDGVIFISIDDNEQAHLKILCDEIFGSRNFRNNIIVKRGTSNIQSQFNTVQKIKRGYETVLLYTKNSDYKLPKPLKDDEEKPGSWNNHWRSTDRPTLRYELFDITPETGTWRWSKERSEQAIRNYNQMLDELQDNTNQNTIDDWYLKTIRKLDVEKLDLLRLSKNGKPEHFVPPNRPELLTDIWLDINSNGSRELKTMLPVNDFPNPKTTKLLKRLLKLFTNDNDIILDSFAGSGTTAQAVMELNKQDGCNRRFILIEMESDIARDITHKRLVNVIEQMTN